MNILTWVVDSSFSTRLTLALLHFLWQGCAIGVLVVVGGMLLKSCPARLRYLSNVAALLLMAICLPVTFLLVEPPEPVAERPIIGRSLPDLPPSNAMVDDASTALAPAITADEEPDSAHMAFGGPAEITVLVPAPIELVDHRSPGPATKSSLATGRTSTEFHSLSRWVTTFYLCGVTLVLARLMRGVWGGHRLRKIAHVINEPSLLEMVARLAQRLGLKVVPSVAWCEQISIPVVVGIVKPMILLPIAVVSGLTPNQLQALMLHELAHIRRFDPIVNLLQRVIEALLFFHPMVWFVSRRISIEREHAADDMVLSAGWDRPIYADALVRVAELSTTISRPGVVHRATVLGASGTSPSDFKVRVLRLLGESHPPALQPSRVGILVAFLVIALGGVLAWSQTHQANANSHNADQIDEREAQSDEPPHQETSEKDRPDEVAIDSTTNPTPSANDQNKVEWGEPANGLRVRVVPVLSSMSEDAIDPSHREANFKNADEVAFVVEIENVSDMPISLLDTRYGKNYGEAKGKASSDWFGQFLFSIDLFDEEGNKIERPVVQVVDLDSVLDGPLVVSVKPNATHRYVLRPKRWLSAMTHSYQPGKYRATVRYHGMPARVATRIKEYRPDSESLVAIEGDVVTAQVAFEILPRPKVEPSKPTDPYRPGDTSNDIAQTKLVWGKPSNGLRSAMSFKPEKLNFEHGDKPDTKLHIQNVSDQPIMLCSLLWVSDVQATVRDGKGEEVTVGSAWYSGSTLISRVTLKPQQIIVFDAGNLGFAVTKARADAFEHMKHRTLVAPAGQDAIQLGPVTTNFEIKDGEGKTLAPLEGDWKGEMSTGEVQVTVLPEKIDCEIVDAVTGKLVSNTTTSFRFIKPATAESEETTVSHMVWGPKGPGQIYFVIPDQVMQRADREELEVRWGVGGHSDYELLSPVERIPLKQFFTEGPKAARETLRTIKLTPKKKEPEPAETRKLGSATFQLPDHLNVMAVGFQPDSKDLVSVSTETGVDFRKWNLEDKTLKHEAKLASEFHGNRFLMAGHLTLSGNCQRVIALMPENFSSLGVWDVKSGKRVKTLEFPEQQFMIRSFACTPDLSLIVCGTTSGFRGRIQKDVPAVVIDVATNRIVQTVTHVGAIQIQSVAISPDGKWFATGGQSAGMSVWEVSTGKLLYTNANENAGLKHPDPEVELLGASQVLCIQFSPDGKQLAFGDMLGVKLVDAATGKLQHRLDAPFRMGRSGLVYSKDGQWLARIASDKIIPIWSTKTGFRHFELLTESNGGAFSDDRQWFAAGFSDQKSGIGLWQLADNPEAAEQPSEATEQPKPEPVKNDSKPPANEPPKSFEPLECELVDGVTGLPIAENTAMANGYRVAGTKSPTLHVTGQFRFFKPKSADAPEKRINLRLYVSKSSSRIMLEIPDEVMKRADRDELELEWDLGNAPVYKDYEPLERIPLKQLLSDDPDTGRDAYRTIKLTPKKKAVEEPPQREKLHLVLRDSANAKTRFEADLKVVEGIEKVRVSDEFELSFAQVDSISLVKKNGTKPESKRAKILGAFDFLGPENEERRILVDLKGLDPDRKTVLHDWQLVVDRRTDKIPDSGPLTRDKRSSFSFSVPEYLFSNIETLEISFREVFADDLAHFPERPSATNLMITHPDAAGRFTVSFDNPQNRDQAGRWELDPEKHQVIFQVFAKDANGELQQKIFKQLAALQTGGYRVDVEVKPEWFDHSTVSVTFVTIQPEHEKWVSDFFHKGKGTSYKGLWSSDGGPLKRTLLNGQHVGWLAANDREIPGAAPANPEEKSEVAANGEIIGRLIDVATGKPVEGATIACGAIINDSGLGGGANAVTDANGRYRLLTPSPGIYSVWLKKHDKHPSMTAAADDGILVEANKAAESQLHLIAGGKVAGKVVDEAGKPQSDLGVNCHSTARPESLGGIQSVLTKDDGSFEFQLPPGRANFYVIESIPKTDDNPFGVGRQADYRFEVPTDGELESITLTLRPYQPKFGDPIWLTRSTPGTEILRREGNQHVTGTVVDETGKPMTGAKVIHVDGQIVTTTERGEFQIKTRKGEQFILHAFAPGYCVWFGTPTSGDVLKIVLEKKSSNDGKSLKRIMLNGQPVGGLAANDPGRPVEAEDKDSKKVQETDDAQTKLEIGKPAPPIWGTSSDASVYSLIECERHCRADGKAAILVEFWSLEDKDRLTAHRNLIDVRKEFLKSQKLQIVSFCFNESWEPWLEYCNSQEAVESVDGTPGSFYGDSHLWALTRCENSDEDNRKTLERYGVTKTPCYFLLDSSGKLVQPKVAPEELKTAVAKYLAALPKPIDNENASVTDKPRSLEEKAAKDVAPNGEIVGVFVDAVTRKPVEGATVWCRSIFNESRKECGAHAVTDAEGRYRLLPPTPGIYIVGLEKYDIAQSMIAAVDDGILVEPGKIAESQLFQIEARRLIGKVSDHSGIPQMGRPVSCSSNANPESLGDVQSAKTNENGEFEFLLPPGRAHVYVHDKLVEFVGTPPTGVSRYGEHRFDMTTFDEEIPIPVTLLTKELQVGDPVWLSRSSPGTQITAKTGQKDVSGIVVDEANKPVPGAKVIRSHDQVVTTDENGEFRMITGKVEQYVMHAFAPGYCVWFGTPTSGDTLKIVLEKRRVNPTQWPVKPMRTPKNPVTIRILGGENKTALAGISVSVKGYGDSRKKTYGTFETDETGAIQIDVGRGTYEIQLSSNKELPYVPVDESWNKAKRGLTPRLIFYVVDGGILKWTPERDILAHPPSEKQIVTFALLPACELVLRAVDVDTGKGIAGVEFGEENAAGEEWCHPIYSQNIGSKATEKQSRKDAFLTDSEGNFKALVGANGGFEYSVVSTPEGYVEVKSGSETDVEIFYGQKRAEHVFQFRKVSKANESNPELEKEVK